MIDVMQTAMAAMIEAAKTAPIPKDDTLAYVVNINGKTVTLSVSVKSS